MSRASTAWKTVGTGPTAGCPGARPTFSMSGYPGTKKRSVLCLDQDLSRKVPWREVLSKEVLGDDQNAQLVRMPRDHVWHV